MQLSTCSIDILNPPKTTSLTVTIHYPLLPTSSASEPPKFESTYPRTVGGATSSVHTRSLLTPSSFQPARPSTHIQFSHFGHKYDSFRHNDSSSASFRNRFADVDASPKLPPGMAFDQDPLASTNISMNPFSRPTVGPRRGTEEKLTDEEPSDQSSPQSVRLLTKSPIPIFSLTHAPDTSDPDMKTADTTRDTPESSASDHGTLQKKAGAQQGWGSSAFVPPATLMQPGFGSTTFGTSIQQKARSGQSKLTGEPAQTKQSIRTVNRHIRALLGKSGWNETDT
jgi:hypothetical protein